MKKIKPLNQLIEIMEIVISDHDISYNEMKNVYTNLRRKNPELFSNTHKEDNKWALRIIKKEDKQYRYRCYVRTVFSCIEGLSFCIKRLALSGYRESEKSIKEKAKTEYEKLSSKKLSVENNIKYSFRLFSKIHSSHTYEIKPGNKEWDNFIKAIKIRHRITHPRTKKDFYVTRNNVEDVETAYNSFIKELGNMIKIWN